MLPNLTILNMYQKALKRHAANLFHIFEIYESWGVVPAFSLHESKNYEQRTQLILQNIEKINSIIFPVDIRKHLEKLIKFSLKLLECRDEKKINTHKLLLSLSDDDLKNIFDTIDDIIAYTVKSSSRNKNMPKINYMSSVFFIELLSACQSMKPLIYLIKKVGDRI